MTRVEGHTGLQSAVLEDLSDAVNYRRWLVDLAMPHLADPALEIGSGTGDYAEEWAGRGLRITASEADPARLAALQARFAGHERVSVRELAVPLDARADYATVVAINVLEHIPDDVAALEAIGRLLRPGGRAVLLVPALPALFSRFDRAIGHQRRYRRRDLVEVLRRAGFVMEKMHYVNAPGAISWFVGVRLLRLTPRAGLLLRLWDRVVVRIARRLEHRWRPPFGQSLFAVARRPVSPSED